MSWLARSLTNSLRLDDDDDDDDDDYNDVVPDHRFGDLVQSSTAKPHNHHQQEEQEDLRNEGELQVVEDEEEDAHSRGVKEDLSEFKQTLTRQFWGVASFLAPPPSQPSTPSNHQSGPNCDRSEPFDQSDQGTNMSSKGEEEDEDELEYDMARAVGITEEVLAFARNIAMHPETWLDFPGDEEEGLDGMYVSCMLECLYCI